jgi:PAS domain-containing protein
MFPSLEMVFIKATRSYVDITIKKKHEEILQNERKKYSNIIANMNLGLIEVDQNDRLLVNHSFCEISGYTAAELIGNKASNLFLNENKLYRS